MSRYVSTSGHLQGLVTDLQTEYFVVYWIGAGGGCGTDYHHIRLCHYEAEHEEEDAEVFANSRAVSDELLNLETVNDKAVMVMRDGIKPRTWHRKRQSKTQR